MHQLLTLWISVSLKDLSRVRDVMLLRNIPFPEFTLLLFKCSRRHNDAQ